MHNKEERIYVAGHRGMVGAGIIRALIKRGYTNLITRTHAELDLTNQTQVERFFCSEKIEKVYLAAARVGGIHANNSYPAEFIYQNLMIEANTIHSAWRSGVQRLLFLGSSCIYPTASAQPIKEEYLMTGQLEPTNEPYAVAKIAGIKLCESYNRQYGTDYRSVMPTNLFGPGDNYHPENSHVIPGLIRRFHDAKINRLNEVVVWGTGSARREFLYVDDMANASVHVMELNTATYQVHTKPMQSHINVGTGEDVTIRELAEKVMQTVGFQGKLIFDFSKPDGTARKLMNITNLRGLGWAPQTSLNAGLANAYEDFLIREQYKNHGISDHPCKIT